MRIVILGGTGMLGSMLADVLSSDSRLSVVATAQSESQLQIGQACLPEAEWRLFKVTPGSTQAGLESLGPADWYLSAIGLTKPYIRDTHLAEIRNALLVNATWPLELAEFAGARGAQVLQIGTDCVYRGLQGNYSENDPHDPTDVYGKSKSLGEAPHPAMHILRTSIIGPEPKDNAFLVAWLLGQPPQATVKGFVNHRWNGVTTLQFARIAQGLVAEKISMPPVQHLVPGDIVTKAELLEHLKHSFNRPDITVTPTPAPTVVDRTLATAHADFNRQLWQAAGYSTPPTIATMIEELARYPYRFGKGRVA